MDNKQPFSQPSFTAPWVIIGLGNPGARYQMTRHNLGRMVVQTLAERYGMVCKEQKELAVCAGKAIRGNQPFHLVWPVSYMNESGYGVARYLRYWQLGVSQLLVVVDDIALPFGSMRLKATGGSGGHNGLRHITQMVGSSDYGRLRLGIEGDRPEGDLADYVLSSFSPTEKLQLPNLIDKAVDAVHLLLDRGMSEAMNRLNGPDGQLDEKAPVAKA